nr:hypothetical protein BaRGS_016854 [Batillaria attramentaria]
MKVQRLLDVLEPGWSNGFVRYALVTDVLKPQWQANQLCTDRGYAGLAVIDTPEKWDFAKVLLLHNNIATEVWLGLEYDTAAGNPVWRGDKMYTWGNWADGFPDWQSASCVVVTPGVDLLWTNRGIDFSQVTAFFTKEAISSTDCGMMCASISHCLYLTYSDDTRDCVMYDASLTSVLGLDGGSVNPQQLYVFNSQ